MVIPASKEYKATLHFEPTEGGATMTAWGQNTSTNGFTLTGANGNETVVVDPVTPASGYKVVGVVATTQSGSVNATETTPGHWEYPMVKQDVDIYVVFDKEDDPLYQKGPYIVTVYKENDDGMPGNTAAVKDLDVDIDRKSVV